MQSGVRQAVIYAVRAKRLLSKGCQGYLSHVVLNNVTSSTVEEVGRAKHLPDVFPESLPGLPSGRNVKISIDLFPGIKFYVRD